MPEIETYNLDMNFEVWGQTDVGLRRSLNEDSILIDRELGLFIVADGMGGHEGGEVASNIAVHTVQEIVRSYHVIGREISPESLIRKCYSEASARIFHRGHVQNPELMGMGTTMVMGLIRNNQLFIGNVGDSRCYMFKEGNMWQLTEDHSLVNEQIRAGVIQPEEAEHVSGKNVITRSVGFERIVEPDVLSREMAPGEMYFLCSDGLTGMATDQQLLGLLNNHKPAEFVSKGIEAAKAGGGDDNISVLLIKIN